MAKKANKIDLRQAFLERQKLLSAELELPLQFTKHPTTLGDATEANWTRMLKSFLPGRYEVGGIYALDAKGGQSEQIDLAIYDRQYSPLWFESGGHRFVPVESVYAIFEIKQSINSKHVAYAANKIASVRRLNRTSAPIVDIYGTQDGPALRDRPIIGGILALRTDWASGLSSDVGISHLRKHQGETHIDLGLSLLDTGFDHVSNDCNTKILSPGLTFSNSDVQLIWFTMHLFRRLQAIGTAPAVDLQVYEAILDDVKASDYPDIDAPGG